MEQRSKNPHRPHLIEASERPKNECTECGLAYAGPQPLEGIEEPFRVCATCRRVLHTGSDRQADSVLRTAHDWLMDAV